MLKGKTYLDKPVTDLQIKHLRIIISNPNEDNEFLTVSVDTFKFDWALSQKYEPAFIILKTNKFICAKI